MPSSAASQFSTDTGSYYNYTPEQYTSHNDFYNFFTFGQYNSAVDAANAARADRNSQAASAAASAIDQDRIDRQRDYEIWYDSTKYQRAVEDLKAAGLNPWLLAQGGVSGSSSASNSANTTAAAKTNNKPSSGSSSAMTKIFASALKILVDAYTSK